MPVITLTNGEALFVSAANTTAQVDCSVTSVTPNTGLNQNGFDIITLTGTNFPHAADTNSTVAIGFTDGITTCPIVAGSMSGTTMQCMLTT